MYDTIEKIGNSVVQHGKLSNRVYVMKASAGDFPGLPDRIDTLCAGNGYTKAVAKTRASMEQNFVAQGYTREASIPGYFRGEEDALFMVKYFDAGREERHDAKTVEKVLETAMSRSSKQYSPDSSIAVEPVGKDDLEEMARIYGKVFPTYPFPITDTGFLGETMQSHVDYFCVRSPEGPIMALASAEKDPDNLAAEMTDFATLSEFRGKGLARALLYAMELHLKYQKYRTAFTIARAVSAGMNITFAQLGYEYSGTLVNNTNISGQIESMNIWWKRL